MLTMARAQIKFQIETNHCHQCCERVTALHQEQLFCYDSIYNETNSGLAHMPRPPSISLEQVLAIFTAHGEAWLAIREIEPLLGVARPTILRRLNEALASKLLVARGNGPTRQYRRLPQTIYESAPAWQDWGVRDPSSRTSGNEVPPLTPGPSWSPESKALLRYIGLPPAQRAPVSYQQDLVDRYQPNQTCWLPASLREKLQALGQIPGERALGTYVRDILSQLLIDLSWASSRLEGNAYSWLDTKWLIESGREAQGKSRTDATMILNHKNAIEFLAEIASQNFAYEMVINNIHSLLMDGLLFNDAGLGQVRNRIVQIEGSVYIPLQAPQILQDMHRKICQIAQTIRDPLESAFFLFTQIPYLQPFEDGNKRTARIACNLPLTHSNFVPLSFTAVAEQDYCSALTVLYERADVSAARDLFEWSYECSVRTYRAVKQSMRDPDPFRMRLRAALSEAVRAVVAEGKTPGQATEELELDQKDRSPFQEMLMRELSILGEHNFARYGLRFAQVQNWLKDGKGAQS